MSFFGDEQESLDRMHAFNAWDFDALSEACRKAFPGQIRHEPFDLIGLGLRVSEDGLCQPLHSFILKRIWNADVARHGRILISRAASNRFFGTEKMQSCTACLLLRSLYRP